MSVGSSAVLTFAPCRVHVSVATLVERSLPPELEAALRGGRAGEPVGLAGWGLGRPAMRWGVHPDILGACGNVPDRTPANPLELHVIRKIASSSQPTEVFPALFGSSRVACEKDERMVAEEQLGLLKAALWVHGTDLADATVVVRVLPRGVATLTVSVVFRGPVGATELSHFLRRLDPRRRLEPSDARGVLAPDLSRLLWSFVADCRSAIRHELLRTGPVQRAFLRAFAEGRGVKPASRGVRKALENALKVAGVKPQGFFRGEPANRILDRDLLPVLKPAFVESKGGAHAVRRLATSLLGCRLVDLGGRHRAPVDGASQTEALEAWARPEVEQLPFCTVDLETRSEGVWRDTADSDSAHLYLFHLLSASYLEPHVGSLEIPDELRAPGMAGAQRVRSLTWSRDSIVAAGPRGALLLFQPENGGHWSANFKELYRRSALDVIEEVLGTWAALVLLNVDIDSSIAQLGQDPVHNLEPLESLAAARRTVSRLLSEPLLYQAEGSTIRALGEQLREAFRLPDLQASIGKKLSQVRDLHDLLLHLEGVRQIRQERGDG